MYLFNTFIVSKSYSKLDTSFINFAHQGMAKALAKNREIENATAFLIKHEIDLIGGGLYAEVEEIIDDMKRKIAKENK